MVHFLGFFYYVHLFGFDVGHARVNLIHGRIFEKDWQPVSLFKNIRDSVFMLIL